MPISGVRAGCPVAVANLWDVTDKDIDRFSAALLGSWVGAQPGNASAAQQQQQGGGSGDVAEAVALSRGACRLPYLIGAAPVCYGLPARVDGAAR